MSCFNVIYRLRAHCVKVGKVFFFLTDEHLLFDRGEYTILAVVLRDDAVLFHFMLRNVLNLFIAIT